MISDQRLMAVSQQPDSQSQVRGDWFDQLEYTVSQVVGYVLLVGAAAASVMLIF